MTKKEILKYTNKIRKYLIEKATKNEKTTYSDINIIFKIYVNKDGIPYTKGSCLSNIGHFLDVINIFEHKYNRLPLGAFVVKKTTGEVSNGFDESCKNLGLKNTNSHEVREELTKFWNNKNNFNNYYDEELEISDI